MFVLSINHSILVYSNEAIKKQTVTKLNKLVDEKMCVAINTQNKMCKNLLSECEEWKVHLLNIHLNSSRKVRWTCFSISITKNPEPSLVNTIKINEKNYYNNEVRL